MQFVLVRPIGSAASSFGSLLGSQVRNSTLENKSSFEAIALTVRYTPCTYETTLCPSTGRIRFTVRPFPTGVLRHQNHSKLGSCSTKASCAVVLRDRSSCLRSLCPDEVLFFALSNMLPLHSVQEKQKLVPSFLP